MHLPDGVVAAPICIGGFLGAATAVTAGLRRVSERQIMQYAVLSALYFAVGAVHVPVGVTSVHLQLTGLLAVLLGWRAIVPVAVGVALQALLLHHGGIVTAGVNIGVLGLPAMAVGALVAPRVPRLAPTSAGVVAGAATVLCGVASIALLLGVVALSEPRLTASLAAWSLANLPVFAGEAVLVGAAVAYLMRIHPGAWESCGPALSSWESASS